MSAHERTGWRDQSISERHRAWGFNCPAADLDFLMVEFNVGLPVALVEYKHHSARPVDLRHPTYRALRALADLARLPFFLAIYWPETWSFRVVPVNLRAREVYRDGMDLCEQRFVKSLYYLRKRTIEAHVLATLKTEPMPAETTAPLIVPAEAP